MLIILLHSSKTMNNTSSISTPPRTPCFINQASVLHNYLNSLTYKELQSVMHLSDQKTTETKELIVNWSTTPSTVSTIDAFRGDIYSGLQADNLTTSDRHYADTHLLILSGLYGALRPLDTIHPYRLEMGYKFPNSTFKNLYTFWGKTIADTIDPNAIIINTSAAEYTKALLPHVSNRIITPKFLTVSPKTGQPVFTAVHAKIARGAFARWIITQRIENPEHFANFAELGYTYDTSRSTSDQPVYIAQTFQGLGLSVRRK